MFIAIGDVGPYEVLETAQIAFKLQLVFWICFLIFSLQDVDIGTIHQFPALAKWWCWWTLTTFLKLSTSCALVNHFKILYLYLITLFYVWYVWSWVRKFFSCVHCVWFFSKSMVLETSDLHCKPLTSYVSIHFRLIQILQTPILKQTHSTKIQDSTLILKVGRIWLLKKKVG